jgi:predicted enzyme related to lactoylglutathione lyase
MSKPKKAIPASILWFEIAADNVERAKSFYSALFGWKINRFPGGKDYWHIDTGGGEDTPDGGLMARCHPQQAITNYVNVKSVDESMAKIEKLGGKVCSPKMPVPGRGYFAMCLDTERNTFAIWETDQKAK